MATLMKPNHHIKAVHVFPKQTGGVLNIRVYSFPKSPDDPEPFIFTWEELM